MPGIKDHSSICLAPRFWIRSELIRFIWVSLQNVLLNVVLKIKNPLIIKGLGVNFADWTGLEPATSAVTGRHSNQLNYQSVS